MTTQPALDARLLAPLDAAHDMRAIRLGDGHSCTWRRQAAAARPG